MQISVFFGIVFPVFPCKGRTFFVPPACIVPPFAQRPTCRIVPCPTKKRTASASPVDGTRIPHAQNGRPRSTSIQCLMLLPSGPDMVHTERSHGTQSSLRYGLYSISHFRRKIKPYFSPLHAFTFPAKWCRIAPKMTNAQEMGLCRGMKRIFPQGR